MDSPSQSLNLSANSKSQAADCPSNKPIDLCMCVRERGRLYFSLRGRASLDHGKASPPPPQSINFKPRIFAVMHSTASSSAGCSFSSSKRVTVNRDNLPLNASLHVCICGEVVLQRPITLPCGHKFHFKCARITVFASADEVCPLCEGGHDEFSLEEEQEEEENNSVSHDSSQHKLSFKYETPEVRGKTTPSVVSFPNNIRPVSLRYATQLIDDSSSAKKKNTGFFASLSPAI